MAAGDRSTATLKLWAPATAMFLAAAVMTVLLHHPMVYFDDWEFVPIYRSAVEGRLPLSELFKAHNGHWMAAPFAVQLALAGPSALATLPVVVASLVAALIGGVVLVRLMAERARAFGVARTAPVLAGLGAFFWFSLDQAPNWFWACQVAIFLNTLGAVLMIALLSRPRLGPGEVAGAMAAAGLAILSFASGLAVMPVGLALIFLHPGDRRRRAIAAAVWVLASAAVSLTYYFGVVRAPADIMAGAGPPKATFGSLIEMGHFTLAFVGGAAARFSDGLASPAALLGLGLAIWAVLTLRRTTPGWTGLIAPFVGLALYGLGAGLLAAYARKGLGVDQALVSRYISFGNFFWLGVLGVAVLAIAKAEKPLARGLALGVIGLVVLLKLGNTANVLIAKDVVGDHRKMVEAVERIRATYPNIDEADLLLFSTGPQKVRARLDLLARERLSIFHDRPR